MRIRKLLRRYKRQGRHHEHWRTDMDGWRGDTSMMKVTLRRALDQLDSLEAEMDLVEETLDWVDEAITFNTQALRTDGPLLESLDETEEDHQRLSKVHSHLRRRIADLKESVLRLQNMAPMAL